MTDSFSRWRLAQQALAEAEHRLAFAMHPSSAALAGGSVAQLRQEVESARREADAALAQCLRETRLNRRTFRRLGLSSSSGSSG